jgi:ferredoxin--NADP+ reductase
MSGADDLITPVIAIVGAGPSGLYCVAAVLRALPEARIDVFDRLPSPFGLVRYGVAPDHEKIKSVDRVLALPFANQRVRFIGNVRVGDRITHAQLTACYDAVVYATGCPVDRGVVCEGDQSRIIGSGKFVSWYSGHPDSADLEVDLSVPDIGIVGAGNVALDVARVLAKPADDLTTSDVPNPVLQQLRDSQVRDVHLIIRGAPHQAKFSYLELLSMEELDSVEMLVHSDHVIDLDAGPSSAASPADSDRVARNLTLLKQWQARRPAVSAPRRVHLHFGRRVQRVDRASCAAAVCIVPSVPGDAPEQTLELGALVLATGYYGEHVGGLPFDADTGTIPNRSGRVVDGDEIVPRTYVAGWIKRGPTGVIASNKADASETARALIADLAATTAARRRSGGSRTFVPPPEATDWRGWLKLDAHEVAAGTARAARRVKTARLDEMLEVCRGQALLSHPE